MYHPIAEPASTITIRAKALPTWLGVVALVIITACVGPADRVAKMQFVEPPVDEYAQELLEFLDEPHETETVGPNGALGVVIPPELQAEVEEVPEEFTEKPAEAPQVAERIIPLEVRIAGPIDSLVGDMVELQAETTAEASSFTWSIQPPVRGLITMDDGSKAVFSNRSAGEYLVIVSCANMRGDTAHATMPFTLRPAPPENPLTVESLADANPPPDIRDLIRRWVAEVESENKTGEASAVAGSLRQTANLLASNQLQLTGDGDPLYEVERAAEIAMGPGAFPKWASFFRRVRDFLYPLNVRGYVQSTNDYANTFNNLAGELEAIAAGK